MLDKCPLDSYDAVSRTVTEDLGAPPESLFASFEPRPIASASLAQVRWVTEREPRFLQTWMQILQRQRVWRLDVQTAMIPRVFYEASALHMQVQTLFQFRPCSGCAAPH